MKKLIWIIGPPASGKMTIGQVLAERTGLKLLHNHMSIEFVLPFFYYGDPSFNRLNELLRDALFKEVAESDLPGLIFTFVCAFEEDVPYMDMKSKIFESVGAEILFVELETDLEERLKRNRHPHRLAHKPSKRDIEQSEHALLKHEEKYRFNSLPGELDGKNHLRINNTNLSPGEVVDLIMEYFQWN